MADRMFCDDSALPNESTVPADSRCLLVRHSPRPRTYERGGFPRNGFLQRYTPLVGREPAGCTTGWKRILARSIILAI